VTIGQFERFAKYKEFPQGIATVPVIGFLDREKIDNGSTSQNTFDLWGK